MPAAAFGRLRVDATTAAAAATADDDGSGGGGGGDADGYAALYGRATTNR